MADVTGPISSLPGSTRASPKGMKCDDCNEADAVTRVQGETDSMGCEMHDLCEACAKVMLEEMRKPSEGVCDWCKSPSNDLRPRRDFEEGMSGPVYEVCRSCIDRENERLKAELDQDGGWD